MQKFTNRFLIGFIVLLLAGCVTLQDVQRSTDLIRSDNELTRILLEVRPSQPVIATAYLIGLANHAKGEADALKGGNQANIRDAIAYYRIASTAYWRSGSPEVANDLFEVANNGSDLCGKLGENAPDRDCLFIRLVIPFAGLESNEQGKGLSKLLDTVNFNDGNATSVEIHNMTDIRKSLLQAKLLVQKILALGQDDRLLSHPGMREYYCDNAKKAYEYYENIAYRFVTKVREFHDRFPNQTPPLGISLDEAREIRTLKGGVPSFCQTK